VAVVGEDFPDAQLDVLRKRKVDLDGLSRKPGKTFRWKGKYGFQLNEAQTLETQLNVFEHFRPTLPGKYRNSELVFLGNIHPDLQAEVLDQVERPALVAADTMNYWIQGTRAALEKTLRRVQMLFVNDAEARQLAGEHNIVRAAKAIMKMGPQRLVIKRAEHGALLFDGEHIFSCPAYPLAEVFDPTGAGDSFAGGFLGYLARRKTVDDATLRQAMVMGSVMASFAVEKFSLDRVKEVGWDDVRTRFEGFRKLTHFDDLTSREVGEA
jgi:fructose-1-phosphate kinase PfkB-like protein